MKFSLADVILRCRCGCGGIKPRADRRDRGFLPGHNRKLVKRPWATCHSYRPHYAHRLCWECYSFEYRLRYEFGMTFEQHRTLWRKQEGRCAICGGQETWPSRSGKPKGLVIDHDSQSAVIRGLLCDDCNCGLGRFHDNPDLLRRAIQYLSENANINPASLPRTKRPRQQQRWPSLRNA